MKREDKNALSKRRIIEAAMHEFSAKGYGGASLNTVCAEYDISKGIIYHYFKDKDELYLTCVGECFEALTSYMREVLSHSSGAPEQKLQAYFDARLHFFVENPIYLGIFASAAFDPPPQLIERIAKCRGEFDELNVAVLTEYLNRNTLRKNHSVSEIVEDFRSYMDFFNMRFNMQFKEACNASVIPEKVIREHEERCHRMLDILLHGVLGEDDE